VQRYAPELERRLRKGLKATNDSWRGDETYVRLKDKWVYLYRAVDSEGATIDFLLLAKRDAAAAERFLAKALGGANHPTPSARQPMLPFRLGSLAHDRRLRNDPHDPQRSSVRKCAGLPEIIEINVIRLVRLKHRMQCVDYTPKLRIAEIVSKVSDVPLYGAAVYFIS
jgi:IS6 family transposase